MKKIAVIASLTAVLLSISGCDFFRTLAGRPTSADIAQKRELIAHEEFQHKHRLDSLKAVQKQISDSLAYIDSIKSAKSSVKTSSQISSSSRGALSSRYYIIIGSFANAENAERLASVVSGEGFGVQLIEYRNGFTAVGACPTDDLAEAYKSLKAVSEKRWCPKEAWILETK